MQRVKAKFNCVSITETVQSKVADFNAVYGKEGENADFTKLSPAGRVNIHIAKDAPAADFFVPGKDYYLVFEAAE